MSTWKNKAVSSHAYLLLLYYFGIHSNNNYIIWLLKIATIKTKDFLPQSELYSSTTLQ